jgi:hypothetical protein
LDTLRARCHQGIKALTTTHVCPFLIIILSHTRACKLHYIHACTYVECVSCHLICLYYIDASNLIILLLNSGWQIINNSNLIILLSNLQVDNVVIYIRANFQVEIPHSLSYAKMKNSEIYNNEQCRFSKSHNLLEFVIFVQPRILRI